MAGVKVNGHPPAEQIKLNEGEDATDEEDKIAMPKSVGLFSAIGLIAGQIIGSGIFISPVGVVRNVHSVAASLIIWGIGGFTAFIGSNCYTELGTMIHESGGDYQYIGKSFGEMLQFMYLWAVTFIVHPGNRAVVALTFATYILKPFFPSCEPPTYAVILVAGFVIILCTVINCVSMKAVTRVQVIFTITKMLALLMIAITGVVYLAMGRTANFADPWAGTSKNPADWAKGIYSCVFTYAGWNYITSVAEEVQNPAKTLPRGIWISVPLVTALYVMTNFAFFALLDINEILSTSAVAVTFGNKVYGVMSWIIPVLVACSTFGGLNSLTYMPSRFYFVGARNGHMPSYLKTVNVRYLTPIPALLTQLVFTLVILVSGEVFALITYLSFVETTFLGISVAGLLYLRRKHPEWRRPVRVNLFFPITYILFIIFLLVITLQDGAVEALIGVGLTLLGVPVYFIFVCWKKKPKAFHRFMVKLTVLVQKITYSLPENVTVQAVDVDESPHKD